MALKALMLRKNLNDLNKKMTDLRAKDSEFEARNAELVKAIEEVETEEQRNEVEAMVAEFESEQADHEQNKKCLEDEIRKLEESLSQEETEQPEEQANEERKEQKPMETRKFFNMTAQERDAFFAREDVQNYLGEVRAAIKEKRAITGVGLTIPTVMLGVLRENISDYSKLYRRVTVRAISGEARQVVQGIIPEAIWTDCCANLNELSLAFNDWELDCFRVGGYYAVCNANLEDSDIALATELMTALGQAIGLALDKAILFGRNGDGTQKMPYGIVTRLVEESKPASYPATARPWVDLHSTNVQTIANTYTGAALFAQILIAAGAAKGKYARGGKFWAMNETTYTYLMAQAVTIDANGAIVAGVNGTMPVIGGDIVVLDFIPNYVIVGGYGDLYLLGERAGAKFASSEHVRFLQDQTVFKGTARYDGAPIIAEGFVAIGINGTTPSAVMTFASDEANGVKAIAINTTTASITGTGTVQLYAITTPGEGEVVWSSATPGKATVNSSTGLVTGVATGTSVITATCNGLTASCTVTVS